MTLMRAWIADMVLEARICLAFHRFLAETDRKKMRQHANHMTTLIKRRSARQVERMERKAGLL